MENPEKFAKQVTQDE